MDMGLWQGPMGLWYGLTYGSMVRTYLWARVDILLMGLL